MDGPRAPDLIERAEAASTLILTVEASPKHLHGLTELRVIAEVTNRTPEVGMVKKIKHLCPELEL